MFVVSVQPVAHRYDSNQWHLLGPVTANTTSIYYLVRCCVLGGRPLMLLFDGDRLYTPIISVVKDHLAREGDIIALSQYDRAVIVEAIDKHLASLA